MASLSEVIAPSIICSKLIWLVGRMRIGLTGVMLTFNEMTQDQHGLTALQILWGQGMNLPMDLTHGISAEGDQDIGGYVRGLRKRLNDIRQSVAPFNKQRGKGRKTLSKLRN